MVMTDKGRIAGTLSYIDTYISSDLAVRLSNAMKFVDQKVLAEAISLEGAKYWKHGSENQHKAVRALLMCHHVFLQPPWAKGAAGWDMSYLVDPNWPKTHFLLRTEEEVKQVLRCFVPLGGPGREDLVDAAVNQGADNSGVDFQKLTRDVDPFPRMQICFDAVRMWLFKAGFVSIPWLTRFGTQITAQTANRMLGDGEILPVSALDNFPRGYIFNFHREGDAAVCHWGISVGGGIGVAANTTAKGGVDDDEKSVNFITGNSVYGKFRLRQSYDVCVRHYRRFESGEKHAKVVIRKLDPTTVRGYF